MDSQTENRVLVALDLMARNGWGIERASKEAKTTRRTVKRYADKKGIDLKTNIGKATKVIRNPDEKVEDFLTSIHLGNSATKSAKDLKTTVRSMSKRTIDGIPIIEKDGNFWKPNFVPVKTYSIVYYGDLVGFGDAVQGRGMLKGPDAKKPKNKRKQDEEYADIWYQIDVEGIVSTLPIEQVAKAYQNEVMNAVKKKLESLNINNPSLVMRFKQNADVLKDMNDNNRGKSQKVSVLENMTKRYDIHMGNPTSGIDEDFSLADKVKLVPVGKYKDNKSKRVNTDFTLYFLRKNNEASYGPIKTRVSYKLK